MFREDISLELIRMCIDNGWSDYCDLVEVYPIEGDHDNCLENLEEYIHVIEELQNKY